MNPIVDPIDNGAQTRTESPPDDDRDLLGRFQNGDQDAATSIYLRYVRRLLALVRNQSSAELAARVEADDIVQSVFRTFFRRAVHGEYEVPEGDELWKLFLVIAVNKIRSTTEFYHAAKRDIRRTVGGELADRFGGRSADEEAARTLKMVVDELLAKLSPTHEQVVRLRIDGCEVNEIADRLKCSKRSVERVLQGFRQLLSGHLSDDDKNDP